MSGLSRIRKFLNKKLNTPQHNQSDDYVRALKDVLEHVDWMASPRKKQNRTIVVVEKIEDTQIDAERDYYKAL